MKKLMVTTDRLMIRPYLKSDFLAWKNQRLGRRPKLNQFDRGPVDPKLLSQDEFEKTLRTLKKAQNRDLLYTFGIFNRSTAECMGTINLAVISRLVYQFANLGYELSNQYWGHGYATEATKGIFPVAFKTLKLHRIEAGIQEDNIASIRVVEKAGLKFEGLREKYYFDGKRWMNLVYYKIIPEDLKMKAGKPTVNVDLKSYF